MLILARRTQQSIEIDERITITVLGIDGGKVRLGIQDHRDMPSVRDVMLQRSIMIDQQITLTVLGIEGGQVRIGIDAPRNMSIVRDDANVRQPRRNGGRQ